MSQTELTLALSLGNQTVTRRDMLIAAVGTGTVLLGQPLYAAAISTPATGLTAGMVQITGKAGAFNAYRAQPGRGGPFPVVLVLHEEAGLSDYIQDVCRRIAQLGALAIVPNLFSRQANVAKLADGLWLDDADATVEWVRASGAGNMSRLGVTGFSWGGRGVWYYCARNPNAKAGVSWYGTLAGDKNAYQPQGVTDVLADLKCPVMAFFGGYDTQISQAQIEQLRSKLRDSSKSAGASRSRIVVLPEARHDFFADDKPSYRAKEAQMAWQASMAWFKANGVL